MVHGGFIFVIYKFSRLQVGGDLKRLPAEATEGLRETYMKYSELFQERLSKNLIFRRNTINSYSYNSKVLIVYSKNIVH